MIDIKIIRENPEIIRKNLIKKYQDAKISLVDEIIELDLEWRKKRRTEDNLRSERNKISEEINSLIKQKKKKEAKNLMKKSKEISLGLEQVEKDEISLGKRVKNALIKIPNIVHDYVPLGRNDSENVEIEKWGDIKNFDFSIKNHVEILEAMKLVDWDASSRVSGTGFYYLKKELALLNQALIRFAIDFMYKKGYEYIEPPLMLNEKSIYASMDKSAIEQSVYSIKGEDLNLIGTSEQALLAMHSDTTIQEKDLPKKYYSYSMCFRKEIGAHGIHEKGLWRTHQFNKVEQFIFCKPEDSEKYYEELLQNSKEILQALDLPYRVLEICTGDLADWKHRSADLEVWRPTINAYGEVMSLSNCTDYQARKLNIKCVSPKGVRRIIHTLNNTALATSRILVALVENNQTIEGSIKIPKVLQPYMGGVKLIGKV